MSHARADAVLLPESKSWSGASALHVFETRIRKVYQLPGSGYSALHAWSVKHPELFWKECWTSVSVIGSPGTVVVNDKPTAPSVDCTFFPEGRLNIAENMLRDSDNATAIYYECEGKNITSVTRAELRQLVARLALTMQKAGVKHGDVVAAAMANTPDTVAVFLAANAIGAVFTSVSPDFGEDAISERFSQTKPVLFFYHDSYVAKGERFDVGSRMTKVAKLLGSQLKASVVVPFQEGTAARSDSGSGSSHWADFAASGSGSTSKGFQFYPTNFNDPAFIMFTSGTTGKPKCLVHRQGILLNLMKEHQFHLNAKPGDRFFYQTTTAWMMWQYVITSMASGCTVVLREGNPLFPSTYELFNFANRAQVTFLGTSAKVLDSMMRAHKDSFPRAHQDSKKGTMEELPLLTSVTQVGSTGSVLSGECFDWFYENVRSNSKALPNEWKGKIPLTSLSGGTDIVGCFMLGAPTLPVRRGVLTVSALGMDVQVRDADSGERVFDAQGELVCTNPFPSMPRGILGDSKGKDTYLKTYFNRWGPRIWVHGDLATQSSEHGGFVLHGRSDSTLKPGGVRIGSADIYSAVLAVPDVVESVCCSLPSKGDEVIALFVVLKPGIVLDDALRSTIRATIVQRTSRYHAPRIIEQVSQVPKTKNGKLAEVVVKNALVGKKSANLSALENPNSVVEFEKLRSVVESKLTRSKL